MIDAYEIGIQLALQDDVSAGLQVISRGLAEVDRAIEATSAKLSNLTNVAQTGVGTAVAGIAARQAVPPGQSAQESGSGPEKEATASSRIESDGATGISPSSAPVSKAAEQAAAVVVQQVVAPVSPEQSKSGSVLREARAASPDVVPTQLQTIAPTIVQVHRSPDLSTPLSPGEPVSSEPQTVAVRAAPVISPSLPSPPTARSAETTKRDADAPVQREKVFTASVGQATDRSRAPTRNERSSLKPTRASEPSADPAGTATAPWSGSGTRILSPRPAAALEQPAAPEARPREQTEGLSGSVMLDGHLVGYWLAEQMAKEASRPPNGTSFFDPRQTPAWTASGSL